MIVELEVSVRDVMIVELEVSVRDVMIVELEVRVHYFRHSGVARVIPDRTVAD